MIGEGRQAHWDRVYASKATDAVSWYEPRPETSLELIRAASLPPDAPIIDVGGGASFLLDELLAVGYHDLTVLDVSAQVLQTLQARLSADAAHAPHVNLLRADVTQVELPRRYSLWHDRAVFHFLTNPADRQGYAATLRRALQPNGQVIIATFGPNGPDRCSGLPTVRYGAETLAQQLPSECSLVESRLVMHQTPWQSQQEFLYCRFRWQGA